MVEGEADGKVGGQFLHELFSALEDLETQSAGILQFLKDKGLATDQELAPYLEAAANASEVRWRAARLRIETLLAGAIREAEEEVARKIEERESAEQKKDEPREEEKKRSQMERVRSGEQKAGSDRQDHAGAEAAERKDERMESVPGTRHEKERVVQGEEKAVQAEDKPVQGEKAAESKQQKPQDRSESERDNPEKKAA
ncbi:MAG: hypothetical protein ACRD3Q_01105 [Terriglobales bacterium]